MREIEMVRCLLCGTHKPIERTGVRRLQKDKIADRQYTFSFTHPDLDGAFISIREARGRGGGFPEVRKISLREAVEKDIYKELRESLTAQCYAILKILMGDEK